MSDVLEKEKIEETTVVVDAESGDHDRFSHVFRHSDVDKAIFTGTPAKALCGKLDIPMKSADKYPACPTCKEIFESMRK